jgi:hypothetical protein
MATDTKPMVPDDVEKRMKELAALTVRQVLFGRSDALQIQEEAFRAVYEMGWNEWRSSR